MSKKIKICILLFLFSLITYSKEVSIGVILDSNSKYSENILESFKKELKINFSGTEIIPIIKKVQYIQNENIDRAIIKLSKDPNIDSIFNFSSSDIGSNIRIKKGRYYSSPLKFIFTKEKYNKDINYISSNFDINKSIEYLKGNSTKKDMWIFVSNSSNEELNTLETKIDKENIFLFKPSKEKLLEASKNKIPTLIISLDPYLNSFSLMGYQLNNELKKRIRASALNYMLYESKSEVDTIKDIGSIKRNLFFNMEVANEIGFYPKLNFLENIDSLNKANEDSEQLSLKRAIDIGLKNNLSVLRKKQDVISKSYSVKTSNSKRLPQLSLNAEYSKLGGDYDLVKNDIVDSDEINSYLRISQNIFNEQLNANVDIQRLNLNSSESKYSQEQLNVIYYITSTYTNILQLQSQLKIQKSNYDLTRESLYIARSNYNIGAGGIQDVYRLESNLTKNFSNISKLRTQIKNQELLLKTQLNVPKIISYEYESVKKLKNEFILNEEILENYRYGSDELIKLENKLIDGALKNSNDLNEIQNQVNSVERRKTAVTREQLIPVVEGYAQYNSNNSVGESTAKINNNEDYWEAGVSFRLPLIKGGETIYEKKNLQSEIDSINYKKESYKNNIRKEVSQTFNNILNNYIQLYSTTKSSELSEKNFLIVKNLYAEGSANITELLDAQNDSLTEQLNNVITNYTLINSIMRLENLYGKSLFLMDEKEKIELKKKLKIK